MKNIKFIGIVTMAIALLTSCGNKKEEVVQTEEKPLVKIEQVVSQPVKQTYNFTATVESSIKNSIAPSTPIRIREIKVEVGDYVSKGQRLVQTDLVNLSKAQTEVNDLQREFDRLDELFKVGGASKQQLDQLKTKLDVAKTSLNNLSENTFLVSPISGVVTSRNYDNGDLYNAQKAILTIEQLNPVKLVINVSEKFFAKVKLGMNVDVKLDVYENETFKGKVSLIYPTIDQSTHTFPVEITVNNGNMKVRPGMFARINVDFGTLNNIVVPDQAIIKQQGSGERFVYVYNNDGTVSYQEVQIGQRLDNKYELTSGINSGDYVVTSGQSRLKDGIEVTVKK